MFPSEYKDLRAIPNDGKKRRRALSNAMHRCYISRAARMLPRRIGFRGMEQPGSSSGS